MCGIAGFISRDEVSASVIAEMTDTLCHRGPDAKGVYRHERGGLHLGHTRLSILDLSSAANQPFYSSSGRFVIIFNGEIYNFLSLKTKLQRDFSVRFRTNSDTEVIVEAFERWGPAMVNELDGMFAIVIADTTNQTLYFFRDRVGKKPLFYAEVDGLFVFASELKSMIRHPAIVARLQINEVAISRFLHLGFIPEPDTIYRHIHKFPSGHYGIRNPGHKLQLISYWSPTDARESHEDVQGSAGQQLASLLEQAVRKRLISDVPLGAFLSGGVDSSLVVGVASRLTASPLKTFSIGFDDAKHDETRFAEAVAKHLHTDHMSFVLKASEALDWMNVYLDQFDEPFADTSAIPTLLISKLARSKVTVALSGDGGDELFHGYGAYRWAERLNNPYWRLLQSSAAHALKISGRSRLLRVSRMLEPVLLGGIRSHIFSQEQYLFSQHEVRSSLLREEVAFSEFLYDDPTPWSHRTSAEKQALFDLQYYLKDDLLVKVDRASMYSGLECRCPLLDHRLVEFALSLSPSYKTRYGKAKWLLKEELSQYLPATLIDRPKSGFSVPLSKWLRNEMRDMFEYFLSDQTIDECGIFRLDAVRQLRNKYLKGHDYLYNRLWAVIVLHRWLLKNSN